MVTYGTASVPYLATWCLQRLAEEETDKYLHAAGVLLQDIYMDDMLGGCDDVTDALQLPAHLIGLLSSAKFSL
jgi:hypothetical protein